MQISLADNETKELLHHRLDHVQADEFKFVHIAHFGNLNQDLINSLTTSVEEMMISAGDKKPLIKRVFSILIEGLQNILLHGEATDEGQPALLILASHEQQYRVVLGNIIQREDQQKLEEYLTRLNGMEEDDVKAFYLEVLNNGLMSTKGGAGLGFITMRMKSKGKLNYFFDTLSDGRLFFSISTDLNKAV
jgi:hypothetical protein